MKTLQNTSILFLMVIFGFTALATACGSQSDSIQKEPETTSQEDEKDLEYYYRMVEDVIRDLDVDPEACKGKVDGQYSLTLGKAKVWIDVWFVQSEGRSYFQVMSPIRRLPAKERQAELFEELLEINDKLYSVAFTIYDDWVWLKHIRETKALEKSEVDAMISRVGTYSDKYGPILNEKYGEVDENLPELER